MSERFARLDALRGFLALGVVLFHCGYSTAMPWYWASMDFFFVMSGFLITRTMINLRARNQGLRTFLVYRVCRLIPSFIVVLLAMELLILIARMDFLGPEFSDTVFRNGFTIYYLALLQNLDLLFFKEELFNRGRGLTHFWSLVLEEQFYLIWGAIFFSPLMKKKSNSHIGKIALIILIPALIVFRLLDVHWWTIPGRADGFIIGSILGALAFSKGEKIWRKPAYTNALISTSLLLGAPFMIHMATSYSYDLSEYYNGKVHFINVSSACFLGAACILFLYRRDAGRCEISRIFRPFIFISGISYELYLVHFPIIELLPSGEKMYQFDISEPLRTCVVFAASLLSAWIMHNSITRPIMKRRSAIALFFTGRAQLST